MAWGKTEEEKAEEARAKEQQRAAAAAAAARAAFAASPVGRATAAFQAGARFFQIELEVAALTGSASFFGSSSNSVQHSGGASDVLGQIEEIGWRLEHAGWVFIETGATSTNRMLNTGQGTVTEGNVTGVYLFRRV